MKVAIAGEALIDFASLGGMRFQGYCGGSPLNTAVAVARLGQDVGYLTQLSTDLFGTRLRRHLEENGVDTRFVLSHPGPTTLAFVERDGETNRYQFLARQSADSLYAPDPLPELPPEIVFLQFGSVSLLADPAATSIAHLVDRHRHRAVIVFDPNVRPTLIDDMDAYRRRCAAWIQSSDLLKLSEEDAAILASGADVDRAITRWLESGPQAVLVTAGANGVRLYRRGAEPLQVPGFRVEVIDTVGAGDTLTAGTIVALLERGLRRVEELSRLATDDWRAVLTFACAAAALNCMRAGANPPSRQEVGDFLVAHSSRA